MFLFCNRYWDRTAFKVVLSDILQCYLTVGFQGFGLSMFAMFINFWTQDKVSQQIFYKTIAYICAVLFNQRQWNSHEILWCWYWTQRRLWATCFCFGMGAMLFRKDQMDLIVLKEAEKEKIENQKRISAKLYQKLAKLEELWDMPMNVDYPV